MLVRKRSLGRKALTRRGERARSRKNLKAEQSAREPWLLATSLTSFNSQQIVALYAKRMQIEESFRDLKCDRHGCAFCYSLTRSGKRLAVLLLLHALATFVAWLSALGQAIRRRRYVTAASSARARGVTIHGFASDGKCCANDGQGSRFAICGVYSSIHRNGRYRNWRFRGDLWGNLRRGPHLQRISDSIP